MVVMLAYLLVRKLRRRWRDVDLIVQEGHQSVPGGRVNPLLMIAPIWQASGVSSMDAIVGFAFENALDLLDVPCAHPAGNVRRKEAGLGHHSDVDNLLRI